jgi:hypothetical protein
VLFAGFAGVALVGLATYRFVIGGTESHGQAKPAFPAHQHPAIPPVAPTLPLFPLSSEERNVAFATGGGEEHRLTQDLIMGWIREGRGLTAEDRESLLAFIGQGQPEGIASGEWEERVNEILNLLRSQPGEVPGLAETMMKMAEEDTNPVLRMYALQHIAMWIPDEPSAESRKAMIDYLRKLSLMPDDPLAGSAVLFLSDLERGKKLPKGFAPNGMIAETALRIASDATASPDVRIAALHACVDQGVGEGMANRRPEIAATARLIAADALLMIPLRKAAIHTIGRFGDAKDRELLERIAEESRVFMVATKPALERLER